jgi:hypothetical protein
VDPGERNGLHLEVLDGVVDAIRGQPQAATVAIRTVTACRTASPWTGLERIGETTAHVGRLQLGRPSGADGTIGAARLSKPIELA